MFIQSMNKTTELFSTLLLPILHISFRSIQVFNEPDMGFFFFAQLNTKAM